MSSSRVVRVRTDDEAVLAPIRAGVVRIQGELHVVPDFPPEVEQAAADAARAPRLVGPDRTDVPLVTIDPPTSMDLDQAVHVARDGDGFLVHYAIADVAAFVAPGDPVDLEAHRRGQSLYGADTKVPLHPPVLSEDAASLLPDQLRPALLWQVRLDADGARTDVTVERARVRSRAKLSYAGAQAALDDGSAETSLRLLKEVGILRSQREAARGGLSLPLPDQEVDVTDGHWHLEFRRPLPVEEWNAQISLLTGFGAASLMVYGRVGLLRTLPEPEQADLQRLHRVARALGVEWPAEQLYPDFLRALDPGRPDHAAVVTAARSLLRRSGYLAFDGEVPADPRHAALANEYAHVTAPLRRLADRYAGEVCVALCSGEPVPDWVLAALPALPEEMARSSRTAGSYESQVVNLVEAGLLAHRVGEEFDAVVVAVREDQPTRGTVMVADVGVEAPVESGRPDRPVPLGEAVRVRLASADVDARLVRFALV